MKWLFENWSLLVVLLAACIVAWRIVKKFADLPSEEQLNKVKEWLMYAVIEAEKIYSSGTGRAKLAYTYNLFVERFPSLAPAIPFDLFSKMVDEVLVEMRKLLETNKDIEYYVNKGE